VERWIRHICEPRRLLLAWQGPDPNGERTRFAVGELLREGDDCVMRYFSGEQVERAKTLGFVGYPAFRLSQREHRGGVLATFLRRLPPRTRPDFGAYKAQFRLGPELEFSDFALLAYTEARLPSDGFSVVNTLEDLRPPCELVLEIVGYRHHGHKLSARPKVDDELEFIPEPNNPHDERAIAIKVNGQTIGYVNRLQTGAFHAWLREGRVRAVLERVNGATDRPRAFMFVSVKDRGETATSHVESSPEFTVGWSSGRRILAESSPGQGLEFEVLSDGERISSQYWIVGLVPENVSNRYVEAARREVEGFLGRQHGGKPT